MPTNAVLETLQKQIEELPTQDQLLILENLIHKLRIKERKTKIVTGWNELYGLGKQIWNEDAQEYVNRIREERL